MQLKVKLLKGGREEVVEVKDGSVSVLELKTVLQGLFQIPAGEQSLVMRGKALLDSSNLDSYGVKDGTKLFLTHKTHTGATPTSETTPTATEEHMETGERVVLTVKLLQGGAEKQVEVASEEVTVGEVKRLVEAECGVPAHLQSLVVEGRALEGWYDTAVFYVAVSVSKCTSSVVVLCLD
ncbi:hypothetical protein GBAR_LOCUS5967 [Geodia barretti]|uniref:Ubiquitin-like domain-containing protein n=1 Tax=Geodia barretti TaxID=519541 RepID=A0AA35RC64_GEOBA|nr:hypothetical protein GBAR_LOCUS5967 [Geodia barretti]